MRKIAIVTGATSGIGYETALGLAAKDFHIILGCRNLSKAQQAKKRISEKTGNGHIDIIQLELSSLQSIQTFTKTVLASYDRLDVLVNNAGGYYDYKAANKDGIEMTMAVNYIGPYYLTELLLPLLEKTPESRIIHVSSKMGLYGSIKLSEKDFKGRSHGFRAYMDSKLAQLIYTIELSKTLSEKGITVNAVHPGGVATNIWQGKSLFMNWFGPLIKKRCISTEEGAETSLYLATSEEVRGITGKLFNKKEVLPYSKKCLDDKGRQRFMENTAQLVKASRFV